MGFPCFPNLSPVSGPVEHKENGLKAELGYSFHEVIVESSLHRRRLEDFSDLELAGLMNICRDRTCNYITCKKICHISLFNNSGKLEELP
jgi:UDPglucose--hexose-1-phosphate uridylyltransferase